MQSQDDIAELIFDDEVSDMKEDWNTAILVGDSDFDEDDTAVEDEGEEETCQDELDAGSKEFVSCLDLLEAAQKACRSETISHLENLALSFLSQLTASLTPKSKRESSHTPNSQSSSRSSPNKIVLELANRRTILQAKGKAGNMRTVQFPKKMKGPSARAPAQLLKVVNEAHEALVNQSPMTKRSPV